jgi:hypothetical protein
MTEKKKCCMCGTDKDLFDFAFWVKRINSSSGATAGDVICVECLKYHIVFSSIKELIND